MIDWFLMGAMVIVGIFGLFMWRKLKDNRVSCYEIIRNKIN